jgi:rubrerythrin
MEAAMTLEEAIKTALVYESRIRDIYLESVEAIDDEAGKKVFQQLADDEQRHVEYLERKLEEWRRSGQISVEHLESVVPSARIIRREAAKIKSRVDADHRGLRQQMLSRALQAEKETSQYYRQLVKDLADDGRQLFSRFLEIENNHVEAVQFELDHVTRTGYWFGFEEFDMEVG